MTTELERKLAPVIREWWLARVAQNVQAPPEEHADALAAHLAEVFMPLASMNYVQRGEIYNWGRADGMRDFWQECVDLAASQGITATPRDDE